jgi:single-stranded DNA-binding protein
VVDVAAYGPVSSVPQHGQLIEVRGFLVTRSWCSAAGERRCNLEIVATEIQPVRHAAPGSRLAGLRAGAGGQVDQGDDDEEEP